MEIYLKGLWKKLAIINIVICAIITGVACHFLGTQMGLFVGAFAFIGMGGLELLWCTFTAPSKEEVDKRNYQEKQKFTEETENNPTIR